MCFEVVAVAAKRGKDWSELSYPLVEYAESNRKKQRWFVMMDEAMRRSISRVTIEGVE